MSVLQMQHSGIQNAFKLQTLPPEGDDYKHRLAKMEELENWIYLCAFNTSLLYEHMHVMNWFL